MQGVSPKWLARGLVLVCERCSRERIPEEDPDVAARMGDLHLRDWLKDKLKTDDRWGPIRAVNTGCLDVCARRRVTVAIQPEDGATQVFVVDPLDDKETLYAKIVELLGAKPTASS